MISKLKVRAKLIVLAVVPLAALAALGVVFGMQYLEDRNDTQTTVSASRALAAVVQARQDVSRERLLAVGASRGAGDLADEFRAQSERTAGSLAEAAKAAGSVDLAGGAGGVVTQLREDVDSLAGARDGFAQAKDALVVVAAYNPVLSRLDSLADALIATAPGTQIDSPDELGRSTAQEAAGMAYTMVRLLPDVGDDAEATASRRSSELYTGAEATRTAFQKSSGQDGLEVQVATKDPRYASSAKLFDSLREGEDLKGLDLEPVEFAAVSLDRLSAFDEADARILTRQDERVVARQAQQDRRTKMVIAILAGGILLTGLVTYLVARSLARPLRQLVDAARRLARETLPAMVDSLSNPDAAPPVSTPIEVKSSDEIGELAQALGEVQKGAGEVVSRQSELLRRGVSDLFVNLARRNQALLDRQIEFIDRLESAEEDHVQLDRLYKLDHLATRMRRNAESLLVLAGSEQARRRSRDVGLREVLQAAIGEVEDYARLEIVDVDNVVVSGTVAIDLAHLLSEIMENSTHYSAPDTMVEVVGHRTPDGNYAVTVSDRGVGMTDQQIAQSNALLAQPPSLGLNVGRSLGFVVVAALAARHGLSVRLTRAVPNGTVVVVTLPNRCFRPSALGGMGGVEPRLPTAEIGETGARPVAGTPATPRTAAHPGARRIPGGVGARPRVGTTEPVLPVGSAVGEAIQPVPVTEPGPPLPTSEVSGPVQPSVGTNLPPEPHPPAGGDWGNLEMIGFPLQPDVPSRETPPASAASVSAPGADDPARSLRTSWPAALGEALPPVHGAEVERRHLDPEATYSESPLEGGAVRPWPGLEAAGTAAAPEWDAGDAVERDVRRAQTELPSGRRPLPRRRAGEAGVPSAQVAEPIVGASTRSPGEVRSMLARYRSAREHGRNEAREAGGADRFPLSAEPVAPAGTDQGWTDPDWWASDRDANPGSGPGRDGDESR